MKQDIIQYNSKIAGTEYLSSFYICSLVVRVRDKKGNELLLTFNSVEAAFHYFKTKTPLFREKIYSCSMPSKARYYGSEKSGCPMRDDWDEIKSRVMYKLNLAKFTQNLLLGTWLVATGEAKLIEFSPWDKVDNFWGVNEKGEGKNKHGRILTKVRAKLSGRKYTMSDLDPSDLIVDMSEYY